MATNTEWKNEKKKRVVSEFEPELSAHYPPPLTLEIMQLIEIKQKHTQHIWKWMKRKSKIEDVKVVFVFLVELLMNVNLLPTVLDRLIWTMNRIEYIISLNPDTNSLRILHVNTHLFNLKYTNSSFEWRFLFYSSHFDCGPDFFRSIPNEHL